MALFRVERHPALPAADAWHRVTDWERHAVGIPLTRVSLQPGAPAGQGGRFTARTGWRRLGFDDPMEITVWRPPAGPGEPGLCRLEKRGRWVRGWAEIEVYEEGAGVSRVVWREELRPYGLPRALDPLLAAAARRVFGRALARLLRAA
ncbi:SRPBCC family protein [Streptomyces sp. NPDC051940]|uniref:SRPBCC family protein n=1 Tax=Streptomyces sp. NPDC051940 TaxID=3155675 RepID=UPI003441C149